MNRRGKAKVDMVQPEAPPFLLQMREQIVAREREEEEKRKEAAIERRNRINANRSHDIDDDPIVVKVNGEDMTEEEYKKYKLDMETHYKLDKPDDTNECEFDMDMMLSKTKSASTSQSEKETYSNENKAKQDISKGGSSETTEINVTTLPKKRKRNTEYLSCSSDEEEPCDFRF